jgi:hydroxymethylglutaryl-CoA reductase
VNSIDEIIESYKRDIDMTLIEESLRRSVEERLQALEEFERFREELRAATERQLDTLR